MVLPDLAAILASAGLGVLGETIFVGAMPTTVPVGIRLSQMQGEGGELAAIRRPYVQAACRGRTWPEASLLADQVYDALTLDRVERPTVTIFSSRPFGQPFAFGREEGEFWHMAVNFTVVWRKE